MTYTAWTYVRLATALALASGLGASGCSQPEPSANNRLQADQASLAAGVGEGYADTPFGTAKVSFVEHDDEHVLVEGDIVYRKDAIKTEAETESLRAFAQKNTWPNATVFYEFDPALPRANRDSFLVGVAAWREKTGVKWVARNGEPNYVLVVPSSFGGGSSLVGMAGGMQQLQVGAQCHGACVQHEMGHAMGLWHEQSRPDRDSYIRVLLENADPGSVFNFQKIEGPNSFVLTPFDYQSIMIYGSSYFSKNGKPTITTLDGKLIQQGSQISASDAEGIKKLYKLGATAPGSDPKPLPAKPSDPRKDIAKEKEVAPPNPAIDPKSEYISLYNPISRRCLELANDSTADGTPLLLNNCTNQPRQRFAFHGRTIFHVPSGKCLDVESNSNSDRAKIQLYTCNNTPAQQFGYSMSIGAIVNLSSSKCLDLYGGSKEVGTPLIQYSCHAGGNQRFSLVVGFGQ